MRIVRWAVAAAALAAGTARAEGPAGTWTSPLGTVRIAAGGAGFEGTLVAPSKLCPAFKAGDKVLEGTLLDDSLAGRLRVCLSGKRCRAKEEWATALWLAGPDKLSGAAHVAAKGCKAPLGPKGGVQLVRTADTPPSAPAGEPPAPPVVRAGERSKREQARDLLRDGANYLDEGNFEAARKQFLAAIDLDAKIPEAYNGVGVTHRMRNELPDALVWYKKALAVNPDFGDAYYNMACVYALEGKRDLALRYLKIARLNGYATAAGVDQDPDLSSLKGTKEFESLRGKM